MSSTTPLFTVPGDDDIDLKVLQNFVLSISWCSKAILEVFYNDSLMGVENTDYTLGQQDVEGSMVSERNAVLYGGQLTVPKDNAGNTDGDAYSNTPYVWYSKQFPLVSGTDMLTKATFTTETSPYGLAAIKVEATLNSGLDWYTWYDTGTAGGGYGYPNGYLDNSGLERVDGADLVSGQNAQLKVTITTDGSGWGGQVDYVALLTDPDLFAI